MFKSKSWLLPARCFITLTPKQQYFLFFFFFFNFLGCNYYHSDITVFDLALLSVSSLECRFPVGRACPFCSHFCPQPVLGEGYHMPPCPCPPSAEGRMGHPAGAESWPVCSQTGFTGPVFVSIAYRGQPQTVKRPSLSRDFVHLYSYPCLFRCVSSPQVPSLPLAPTADLSDVPGVPSGLH